MKIDKTIKRESIVKYGLSLVAFAMMFARLQDKIEQDHQTLSDTVKDTHRLALAVAGIQAVLDERGNSAPMPQRRGHRVPTADETGNGE